VGRVFSYWFAYEYVDAVPNVTYETRYDYLKEVSTIIKEIL